MILRRSLARQPKRISIVALLDSGGAPVTVTPAAASTIAAAASPIVVYGAVTVTPVVGVTIMSATSPVVQVGAAVTITPAAGITTISATSPTVQAGAAITVTPDAAAVVIAATSPVVVHGAAVVAPAVAVTRIIAVTGDALSGACTAGVLTVDPTNGRYFRNGSGIVFLAGFHTWASIQDSWPSLPITALDFDEYLAALVSYGCNFTKAWILESAKDWGDSVQYFAPLPWARTGPGTAHDGRPKFDLTQFDTTYFERLRERCIRLGNAGIYVCVQLFQGWHVSKKGFGTGDPWANHPMNAANNINGIDGDTNGDVVGLETRTTTLTATYNIQKAYVAKVIDTLNDLDNVFWEISNEEENSSLTWQRALVDYIQTYEAGKPKQHIVGMTVCWPSGDNQDLYDTTTIDWLSPGGDFVPETASAAKISAFDTDHVGGLTSEYKWIFRALCQGHGGAWYMDEWAGETYGNDTRSNATYQKIRSILGYALDYAARIDLANATPQPSLASTGYCLAKTTGAAQILAYQDGSGSFTVNLTGISGTLALEWLRTANGTTQAGSSVSGGATRTLTPPWAGEDVMAFLESVGVAIAPVAAATRVLGVAPTVVLGAVAVTPAMAFTGVMAAAPIVVLGSIAMAPAVAASAINATAPTVVQGAVTVTPAVAAMIGSAIAPTIIQGALAIVPAAAIVRVDAVTPTIVFGAITITPTVATTTISAVIGAIISGSSIALTPATATMGLVAVDPTVIADFTVVYTPAAAVTRVAAVVPTVVRGAIAMMPAAATTALSAASPDVVLGADSVIPASAATHVTALSPVVVLGAVTIAPAAAVTRMTAIDPTIEQGIAVVVQPAYAAFVANAIAPSVVHGVIVITPGAAGCAVSAAGGSVIAGVIVAVVRMHIERSTRVQFNNRSTRVQFNSRSMNVSVRRNNG